MLIVKTHLAFR